MNRSILLIDDDTGVLDTLSLVFTRRGWTVVRETDGLSGLKAFDRERPHVVLLDVKMPGVSGLDVLQVMLRRDPEATVIMLTGHGDIEMSVEAMRLGAENFLTKPVSFEHLELAAEKAYEKSALRRQARFLAERGTDDDSLASLGDSPAAQELARQLALLAAGSAPILLTGETGTGKGRTAKLVHGASPRAAKPFVAINCAGLTPTFLDTELFGHEKGAFTDAKVAKPGLYEVADGGTIFLDEIGDLAPELQPKLLTVLETNQFRRLGGTREIEVDVRLIAATHKDLSAEVKKGRFREDLYYRLAVLPVHLPPLRERDRTEVAQLAIRLVNDLHRRNPARPARINAEALSCLTCYAWPGNVRELRNVLERAMLIAGNVPALTPAHLPNELRPSTWAIEKTLPDDASLEAVTRRHILQVLERAKGNRLQAARMLGITRSTLYKRLGEYGIAREKAKLSS